MAGKVKELRGLIYAMYDNESVMATQIGWSRQRLNKITNGEKEPDVEEINTIAKALGKDVGEIVRIFLRLTSPNGQRL